MTGRKIGIGITISVVVAAALIGTGIRYVVDYQPKLTQAGVSGTVKSSGTARIGGAFSMVDHKGRQVTDRDFLGKFMLISFGYTFCPDVCPTELQTMSEALDALGEQADKVQPVFATIDPERDTAAVLADYLSNFHPRFIGLTGTTSQVADIARTFGVYYSRVKSQNAPGRDKDYLMNHSAYMFLMDGNGKFRAAFRAGIARDGMVRRIRDELAK
ncbi:MAG: SCO family protein [Rhodospirillales bacterium]|nr:SCO family protein [Rhodospirillales bacterium]